MISGERCYFGEVAAFDDWAQHKGDFMRRLMLAGLVLSFGAMSGAATPDRGPGDLQALVRDLGSADFAIREAAQRRLEGLPFDRREELVKLAQTTSDPEVQSRLQAGVEEIEFRREIDPPPISLHIKDATDEETVQALGKALGISLRRTVVQPDARYTLDADQKSYWDIYRALSLQHPLWLHTTSRCDGDLTQITSRGDAVKIERHGGVTLVAVVAPYEEPNYDGIRGISGTEAEPEAALPADARKISVVFAHVVDPRVHLLKYWVPLIGTVVDDTGKVLAQRDTGTEAKWRGLGERTGSETFEFVVPKQGGSRTLSIKGEFRVLVPLECETREFDGIDKQLGKTFEVGGRSFALTNLAMSKQPREGRWYDMTIALTADEFFMARPAEATVFDGERDGLFGGVGEGSLGGSIVSDHPIVTPLKLVITVALKTKEWRIPFELKGIPVPP
jgi:hypothetical protein